MEEENNHLLDEFVLKEKPERKWIPRQQRSIAGLVYAMFIFVAYAEIDSDTQWDSDFAHYFQFVFNGVVFGLTVVAIAISISVIVSLFVEKNISYGQRVKKMFWLFLLGFSIFLAVILTYFVLTDLIKMLF